MNGLGSDQENILILEKRINQQYAPIRGLKEPRNRDTHINQLHIELLSRIFKEVGYLNRQAGFVDKLPSQKHCTHLSPLEEIALDLPAVRNRIATEHGVDQNTLKHYISKVEMNQHIELISHRTDWNHILSAFEGSKSRIKSLVIDGNRSIQDFLKVGTRYQSLASIVPLVINDGRYCSTLPIDMPFFAHANQPSLQALSMGKYAHSSRGNHSIHNLQDFIPLYQMSL